MPQPPVFAINEFAKGTCPSSAAIFAKHECSAVHCPVAVPRQQPFGIDRALLNQCRNHIDEKTRIDDAVTPVHKVL